MFANPYICEKLLFERTQERQREIEQRHLLASLRRSHSGVLPSCLEAIASSVAGVLREQALRAVTVQYLLHQMARCLRYLAFLCVCMEILL